MHLRFAPKIHHLELKFFMFYLDLDELDSLSKEILPFSHNRRNLYSFNDSDHEPAGENLLKDRILLFLRKHDIEIGPLGRIKLLTLPRVAGYIFNPISIYFCFDGQGKPVCSVAEVGNTFREKKLYLLRPEELAENGVFKKIVPKHFYVSPFSPLDLNFDFRFKIPGETLDIKVDDRDGEGKVLITSLTGKRKALNNRNLLWFSIKYPLVTLQVIFLIHWHALILWLKGAPFYRKAGNAQFQREVLRPHATLVPKPK
jgi:DUF1365 family protein